MLIPMLIIGLLFFGYGIFLLGLVYTFNELNKSGKFFITCMVVVIIIGTILSTITVMLFQIENYFNIKFIW